jgi:tetratricopeptide (TPR) repeat protein
LYDQGREAINRGDYEEAKKLFEEAKKAAQDKEIKKKIENSLNEVVEIINNKEADQLNGEGWNELNNGNYEAARDKFSQAYNKCAQDYENREMFRQNFQNAMGRILSVQGSDLMRNRNYRNAIEKYREANIYFECHNYHNQIAECYFAMGNESYENQDFEAAKEFYQKAIKECSLGYKNEAIFRNRLESVDNEIKNSNAEKLNAEGLKDFQAKKFKSAHAKFSQALQSCTSDYKNVSIFRNNMHYAKAEIYNSDAKRFQKSGQFDKAIKAHKDALATIPREKSDDIKRYKNDLADVYNEMGNDQLSKEEFNEAKKYFEMAINESSADNLLMARFEENLAKANNGIRNQYAEKLFNDGEL